MKRIASGVDVNDQKIFRTRLRAGYCSINQLEFLGDTSRRERTGQQARAKAVSQYSVEKILERTLSFYERILAVSP